MLVLYYAVLHRREKPSVCLWKDYVYIDALASGSVAFNLYCKSVDSFIIIITV